LYYREIRGPLNKSYQRVGSLRSSEGASFFYSEIEKIGSYSITGNNISITWDMEDLCNEWFDL